MGQTTRLRLIQDRFITGHSNCDLRRHWESRADPAVRRIGKPNPDPTYPTYAVGDEDSDNEATRVAVVTGQRSGQNQLEDLLRWAISTAERPVLKPEVSDVEKLLQQLVREPQSRPPAVVSPPVPTALEQMLHSFLDGQRQRQRPPPRQRPTRRDCTDVVCFFCGKSGHTATRYPNLNEAFPFLQPGWQTEKTSGGFAMIPRQVTTNRPRAENGG